MLAKVKEYVAIADDKLDLAAAALDLATRFHTEPRRLGESWMAPPGRGPRACGRRCRSDPNNSPLGAPGLRVKNLAP